METVSVDRFEGEIAVCEKEDMTKINIAIEKLPAGTRPGNILNINDDGTIVINKDEETCRRKAIADLYNDIMKKGFS